MILSVFKDPIHIQGWRNSGCEPCKCTRRQKRGGGGAFDGLRKFVNFEKEKSIKCDKVEQNEQVTKKREMSLTK